MLSDQQRKVIRELKGWHTRSSNEVVPILNDDGICLGTLRPVDGTVAAQPNVVAFLSKWRQMFMKYFMTQFTATEERTGRWLKEIVLPDDTKILFLIYDDQNLPVGNFAVRDISSYEAELDNLIRGEKGGDAKLVFYTELSMLHWLFSKLGVERVVLRVLSNNPRVVAFHKSAGFKESGISYLKKLVVDGEIRYSVTDSPPSVDTDMTLIHMALEKKDFYLQHPGRMAVKTNG